MKRLGEAVRASSPRAPVRILFPEGAEPRVVAAAHRLAEQANVVPLLLGEPRAVADAEARLGLSPQRVPVLAPEPERYVDACARLRDLPPTVAARLLKRPAYLAAMMLREGDVDTLVVGAAHATGDVLIALETLVGLAPGATTTSSFFVIEAPFARPDVARRLVFADCAANPEPTAEALVEIALGAAEGARLALDVEPRVAMLSYSTHCSATHPNVEKVARATALLRARAPALLVDGDIQADAALDPVVAGHKLPSPGPIAGRANVLVFPDLEAANIGYKLLAVLGGAEAYGVFLQGFARPAVKVSRGSSVDEIVTTSLLLARLIDGRRAP